MIEYLIAFAIIIFTVLYFVIIKAKNDTTETETPQKKENVTMTTFPKDPPLNDESSFDQKYSDKLAKDNKELILNTFKEVKDLRNVSIYANGKIILFSDEKRISIGFLNNLREKNPRFISKTVEQDLITDLSFSEDAKNIAVGLKNSKEILFYDIVNEAGKQKLNKSSKKIPTERKFEIKNIAYSKDGNYLSTSGTGQDTEIQIFDTKGSGHFIQKVDTGGIQNLEIKMTPDDHYLTVSTFLNEISVIEFQKTLKFNKKIEGDEVILKIQRNKSVGGIKVPILYYQFSNDNRFFIVSCENRKVKIFQNFGNFEESKLFSEFEVSGISQAPCTSLYVSSFLIGKLNGHVAVCSENNIIIYSIDGQVELILKHAHETEIILLKLVDDPENPGLCLLISASRDGRFYIWDLNILTNSK